MDGQAGLAAVFGVVPVDVEGGHGGAILGDPLAGEALQPVEHAVGGGGEGRGLAAQGVGMAAAVEAQQAAPFAGGLAAQAFGRGATGHQQEGAQQEHRGRVVVAGEGAEGGGVVQQAGLQQGGQGEQDAAVSDGLGGLEARSRGPGGPEAGGDAGRDMAGGHAHGGRGAGIVQIALGGSGEGRRSAAGSAAVRAGRADRRRGGSGGESGG